MKDTVTSVCVCVCFNCVSVGWLPDQVQCSITAEVPAKGLQKEKKATANKS